MKFFRSRRGAISLGASLLLVLFLFRPGVGRLKSRIANSIGQAIQRQVEIGSVHLHLLPSPGFDLDEFVVHDDPSFGAEPMLRAQEVTASLRLAALLRARLEVSRLSLTEPSLNLVRNDQGHWNIESILEHTAQTSVGPTGRGASLVRPQFPYIEADHGRINFKLGSEKKSFALSDADYSFWQDSDSAWGMRLKAAPIRTDFNLTDTGTLRASGTWQRAGHLRETPLQFAVQWEEAQLGQLTKLVSGADRGWRGTVRTTLNLSGEPSDLLIAGDLSVEDFRRYDLAGGEPLRLATHCDGHYSSVSREFHDILCMTPIGDGRVTVRGDVHHFRPTPSFVVNVNAESVPLSAVLRAAHRAKRDLPPDLQAEGLLTFGAKFRKGEESNQHLVVEGSGSTKEFKLESASTKSSLVLGQVPIAFTSQSGPEANVAGKARAVHKVDGVTAAGFPRAVVGPFRLNPTGVMIRGILTSKGYAFASEGDADIKRLLLAARAVGIPASSPVADGIAKLDLTVAGEWTGFAAPQAMGTAQLRATRIQLRGLNGPVEINSATIRLQPDRVDVEAITASLADSHWKGSFSLPRGCSRWSQCRISFDLQADEIIPERLRLFGDPTKPSPWYRVLSASSTPQLPLLTQLQASGRLRVARLILPNVTAAHVSSDVDVDSGRLHLSELTADVFGGKHSGTWDVDFTTQPPLYAGNGTFKQVALPQVAAAMHDPWLTGSGSGAYRVEAHGHTLPELLGSATGSLQFDVRGGELAHVILEDSSLKLRRFTGVLALRSGKFEVQHGVLDSVGTSYAVSGNASWSCALDFTLLPDGAPGVTVTGTLAAPKVVVQPTAATRATLQH